MSRRQLESRFYGLNYKSMRSRKQTVVIIQNPQIQQAGQVNSTKLMKSIQAIHQEKSKGKSKLILRVLVIEIPSK